MLDLPPPAVGAVTAAFIAGAISLLGLIISKENKTSELRQAWIDAVRTDLSQYISEVRSIEDGKRVRHKTQAEKLDRLAPFYSQVNRSIASLTLRLNPKENESQQVLQALSAMQRAVATGAPTDPRRLQELEAALLEASQLMLKTEWERVKGGEPTFRFAKWLIGAVIASSALFLVQGAVSDRLGISPSASDTLSDTGVIADENASRAVELGPTVAADQSAD